MGDQHSKTTKYDDRNKNYHGRTFQLLPTRPGALAQLLAGLLHIIGEAGQMAGAPEPDENAADDHGPNDDPNVRCILLHSSKPWRRGRDSNPRPAKREAVFK